MLYPYQARRFWRTLTRSFSEVIKTARNTDRHEAKRFSIEKFKRLIDNEYNNKVGKNSKGPNSDFSYACV